MLRLGNVAENWSYFGEQWINYETAPGLSKKNEKIFVATLRGVVIKIATIFIKNCPWKMVEKKE